MSDHQEQVIACNLQAIDDTERDAHIELAKEIYTADMIMEIQETEHGYKFRLPLETSMLHKVIQYVSNERLCCPFFTFTLVVGEQFWLELSGTDEVKDLIKSDVLNIIQTGDFPTEDALRVAYEEATAGE